MRRSAHNELVFVGSAGTLCVTLEQVFVPDEACLTHGLGRKILRSA
jgi:hypothetical protein